MSKESVKALINEKITANGVQAITGPVLNNVLNTMVDEAGAAGEFIDIMEEGLAIVDKDLNIGVLINSEGVRAINSLNYIIE